MRRIVYCESGSGRYPHGNPYAYNGAPLNRKPTSIIYGFGGTRAKPNTRSQKSTGLAQFMPSTWNGTPYRARSIWSAKWSALAAAWMYNQKRSGEWVCK